MKKDIFNAFLKDYSECKDEFILYFKTHPVNIIYQQIHKHLIPKENEFNKEDAAIFSADLLIFCLFLKIDIIKENNSDNFLYGLNIFKKNYRNLREKYHFQIIKNINVQNKNLDLITPEIFSFIAEKMILISENPSESDSGTIFTPNEDIYLICINILFYNIKKVMEKFPKKIIGLLNLMDSENSSTNLTTNLTDNQKKRVLNQLNSIKILDPSCGSGRFLIIMLEILFKLNRILGSDIQASDIISKNLFGIDINPQMVLKTRILLSLKTLVLNGSISKHKTFENFGTFGNNTIIGDTIREPIFSQNEKFDVVMGNPPFVRQENIKNKNQISKHFTQLLNSPLNINKRSDLYIYFFYRGIFLLKKGGILAFISSNSWLNIGFGFNFQDFLLKNTNILAIIDSRKRKFDIAEINTVITFLVKERPSFTENSVHFIKFLNHDPHEKRRIFFDLYNSSTIDDRMNYRIYSINQSDLYQMGVFKSKLKSEYRGSRWGNIFFLAPPIFFKINKLQGSNLIKLGEIAEITRGITTGINKYFILKKIKAKNKKSGIITVQNGFNKTFEIERKFLHPIVISPKHVTKPKIEPDQINFYILDVNPDISQTEINNSLVKYYIKYGENLELTLGKGKNRGKIIKGVSNIPSLKGRKHWYHTKTTQSGENADIFIQKIYNTIYRVCCMDCEESDHDKIFVNNTFYNVALKPEFIEYRSIILASLLSSLTYLSIELNARRNFGGGALDTATFDIENVMLLNPKNVDPSYFKRLAELTSNIIHRNFMELPEEVLDKDRKNLDILIFKILEFSNPEQIRDELYNSIIKLTEERIKKSNTFRIKK
ncbi:MAG: HsdM family class I SAM-dependent methyltransferase [Promethearchaeota archaeon]